MAVAQTGALPVIGDSQSSRRLCSALEPREILRRPTDTERISAIVTAYNVTRAPVAGLASSEDRGRPTAALTTAAMLQGW